MKRAVANLVNAFYEGGDPFGYRDFESIISPESPEEYTLKALETNKAKVMEDLREMVEAPIYDTLVKLINLVFE